MTRQTGGLVDNLGVDNLIAKIYPQPDPFVVELATPGAYARGTVLSFEADGKYEVLGSGSGTASAILSDDTLENDDTAVAFRSGHFNRKALIVADGYALTAADENNLRLAGIFLSDAMGNAHGYADGVIAAEIADDLYITSEAGTTTGKTALTVSPEKGEGNSYKYKVGDSAEIVTDGQDVATGWSAWDGTSEIAAATGKIISVVECDSKNKTVRAGSATVTAKAAAAGLTVVSAEGTNTGDTKITVTPAKASGNSYKYKVDTAAASVGVGDSLTAWTDWDGSADITAQTGKVITVAECDGNDKAVKAGSATVTARA